MRKKAYLAALMTALTLWAWAIPSSLVVVMVVGDVASLGWQIASAVGMGFICIGVSVFFTDELYRWWKGVLGIPKHPFYFLALSNLIR